ncbi:MAG: peptidoglycan editing factor PgeF [Leptolyngbyaceae cyanobacterium SM2_3_12]|nr:peptidoglycan editing factor PgeF [Leptolyngbyaceae cyanobacterium SM2_3_12]
MELWQWQPWQGQSFLTCTLLQPWPHGFFTRNGWPQTPESLTQALDTEAAVQRVKQVHGNRVVTPRDIAQGTTHPSTRQPRLEADALVSDAPRQSLWVCSADCSPVLIGDRSTGQTAAIHAGWRGTARKVVPQTIAKMQNQGSRLKDLVVAIGPAIAGSVYQVSTAVAAEVGRTIAPDNHLTTEDEALVIALQAIEGSPLEYDPEPGKVRLDVRQVNIWQLHHLGLSREQVSVAPHCTFQEPERFFSYRRTGEKQVQWSGIVSR